MVVLWLHRLQTLQHSLVFFGNAHQFAHSTFPVQTTAQNNFVTSTVNKATEDSRLRRRLLQHGAATWQMMVNHPANTTLCICLGLASVVFGRPFVKRYALCYWTIVLSCPVCDVGGLWPNGWMHQDETWHGGRPRPRPHCVRWGPGSTLPKGAQPQFSAHVCCGQTAGWIKMPLGSLVGFSPGDIVLDGDPSPP